MINSIVYHIYYVVIITVLSGGFITLYFGNKLRSFVLKLAAWILIIGSISSIVFFHIYWFAYSTQMRYYPYQYHYRYDKRPHYRMMGEQTDRMMNGIKDERPRHNPSTKNMPPIDAEMGNNIQTEESPQNAQ